MKARRKRITPEKAAPPVAPPSPVYLAESDPRQANGVRPELWVAMSRIVKRTMGESEQLAREFGPWARANDGTWFRKRP